MINLNYLSDVRFARWNIHHPTILTGKVQLSNILLLFYQKEQSIL